MKRNHWASRFICIFLIISLVGCGQVKSTIPVDFPSSTPLVDFLEITELSSDEKLRETNLDLYIVNKTQDCVIFPYDFGVQIFIFIGDTWKQIPNLVEFPDKTNITLSANSKEYADAIVNLAVRQN